MNDKIGFQIGDTVYIVGPTKEGNYNHLGERFMIEQQIGQYYSKNGFPWYPDSSLLLTQDDLKIGDIVEVIGPSGPSYYSGSDQDDVFRIDRIVSNKFYVGKRTYPYPSSSLRKITPDEVRQPISIPARVQTLDMIEERLKWLQEQIDREKKILRDVEDSQLNYRKRLSDVEHIVSVMLKTMQAYGKIQCKELSEYFDPKTIECAEWVKHRLKDIK